VGGSYKGNISSDGGDFTNTLFSPLWNGFSGRRENSGEFGICHHERSRSPISEKGQDLWGNRDKDGGKVKAIDDERAGGDHIDHTCIDKMIKSSLNKILERDNMHIMRFRKIINRCEIACFVPLFDIAIKIGLNHQATSIQFPPKLAKERHQV